MLLSGSVTVATTGCSTVLIPRVAEPAMVTPEVVSRQEYGAAKPADASRFLIGPADARRGRAPRESNLVPCNGRWGGHCTGRYVVRAELISQEPILMWQAVVR